MKLHVQCDRCKKYAETNQEVGAYPFVTIPPGPWHKLVAFAFPVRMNEGYPEGPIAFLLCGDCLPVVQRAVEAAVARKT